MAENSTIDKFSLSVRFLKFACSSTSEVQSGLYLALDRGYISQDDQKRTYNLAVEVKRLINGLINYLKKSHASTKKGNQKIITAWTAKD